MSKQYDEYLDNHISNVLKGYIWMTDNGVLSYDSDLVQQLSQHDMSKRDAEEYETYDMYFYGCDVNNRPKEIEQEFLYAFLHHLHHNPHHWQHWVLIQDTGEGHKEEVLDIPSNYVVEMVCDWWSFSWSQYNSSGDYNDLYGVFDWYDKNKSDIKLSEYTRRDVEELLSALREELDAYFYTGFDRE